MSKYVQEIIDTLIEHKDDITSLLVIGDTKERQIVQLGAGGASRQELQSIMGAMDIVKMRIAKMLLDEDTAENTLEYESGEQDVDKIFDDLLSSIRQRKENKDE